MPFSQPDKPILAICCSPYLSKLYNRTLETYTPHEPLQAGTYGFDDLNLEEVVILAKEDKEAQEELLCRLTQLLHFYAERTSHRCPQLDYYLLYSYYQETALKLCKQYQPGKGDFLHYLRKSLHFTYARALNKVKKEEELAQSYFTYLPPSLSPETFRDSASDSMIESITLKIDLQNFLDSLDDENRNIFRMYLDGYTLREIGSTLQIKLSTVDHRVKKMMSDFVKKVKFSDSSH